MITQNMDVTNRNTAIPSELKSVNNWLTWDLVEGVKVPNGKSNDSFTWYPFDRIKSKEKIAYVFSSECPFTGIDLDDCIVDGDFTPFAQDVLNRFRGKAYAEISPSGTGVKLWVRGKKPKGCRSKDGTRLEVYDHNRFFCVTGESLAGFESIDGDASIELAELCGEYLSQSVSPVSIPAYSVGNSVGDSTIEDLHDIAKRYVARLPAASEGGRNNAAFSHAGHLRKFITTSHLRLSNEEITQHLRAWNAWNNPPLSDHELRQAVISNESNGTSRPDELVLPRSHRETSQIDSSIDFDNLNQPVKTKKVTSFSLSESLKDKPQRREVLIEGLLRRGETMNIIAAPKVGKSWLTAGIAFSVANGLDWMGMKCERGRVFVFDLELHKEEILHRYDIVREAMGCSSDGVQILPLRGSGWTIIDIAKHVREEIEVGQYALIVIDALYRTLPPKTSENDNAAMMAIYNQVDEIARHSGASVAIIHHSSKGDQSTKGVTDSGSGAGAISRAADTHLVLRPHELAGCVVAEAVTRSFQSPNPLTLRSNFPIWEPTHIEPAIKQAKPNHQSKQDEETKRAILKALSGSKWLSKYQIKNVTGFGESRVTRGLNMLSDGQIETKRFRNRKTGVSSMKYKAKP